MASVFVRGQWMIVPDAVRGHYDERVAAVDEITGTVDPELLQPADDRPGLVGPGEDGVPGDDGPGDEQPVHPRRKRSRLPID